MQFLLLLAMLCSAAAPKIAPIKAQIRALSANPAAAASVTMSPTLARALVMPQARVDLMSKLDVKTAAKLQQLADIAQDDQGLAMQAYKNLYDDAPDSKKKALKQLEKEKERIAELQDKLFAGKDQSLLVVLQAMDTAGKDGVIKHVFSGINPAGVQVTAFKKPTSEEAAHDYLWRIHPHTPTKGMIGIFNRSHYEDILVPTVLGKNVDSRYKRNLDFEATLREEGTTVLKIFLDVSKKKQKERLQARLDDKTKTWKFDPNDLATRKLWKKYMKAYRRVLAETAPDWWQVPANKKWFRNWLVARIIRETLEGMDPKYPKPADGVEDLKVE